MYPGIEKYLPMIKNNEISFKKILLWMIAPLLIISSGMTLTSCGSDDPTDERIHEEPKTEARVYETIRYEKDKTTAYNFEYPSTDPYGKEVMLSGTITVGDEVTEKNPGRGLVLYSHYTIYRADECPSKGGLDLQKFVTGSGLITISPDYYGFGITEDKPQAYCISKANARAAVDALLAAKQLLPTLGYQWDDNVLFNLGYSQGGQTALGIVRLIDEQYRDLHITYTFAGGGLYDIPMTYQKMIESDGSDLPSSLISVLLAYNEFCQLNIPYSQLFQEPLVSHIDEWFYSKKYDSSWIDYKLGSTSFSQLVMPDLLNINSNIAQRFIEVLEKDNLCKGWLPRKENRFLLVHNTKDRTVPSENTKNLYQFLLDQGVPKGNISYNVSNMSIFSAQNPHEMGAVFFAFNVVPILCEELNIKIWIDVNTILDLL